MTRDAPKAAATSDSAPASSHAPVSDDDPDGDGARRGGLAS